MTSLITSTRLWRIAFGKDCLHARELEQSLLQARESVGELLAGIPGDMKGYTVHNLSHLDALWEMADLIAGDKFSLNAAEAYVFGIAVLLHDAGMTVMAYPGGMNELIQSPIWLEECSNRGVAGKDLAEIPAQIRSALVTNVLRRLHAERAEHLATQAWVLDGVQYRLVQNDQLRDHYGPLAGKVAHSHHWEASTLQRRFPNALGALGEMPAEWVVQPLKIATLLRCADAAHIDHRRAPRLSFAMTKPEDISQAHWSFQSKLAKPYVKDKRLCYTTTDAFTADQVDAWYLCFDTARMVERELVDAEENLRTLNAEFAVDGVCGVKSVGAFAEYVQVNGWKPVDVDIQVSDVPALARTLGGSALYSSHYAPLRELIQNAADSIDARCSVDPSFSKSKGAINIRLRPFDDSWRLDVEDNGIGMSERILTRALLDFGKSFWRSELLQEEYPGIHGGFVDARGRYGIGFFSVFMWSDHVAVSSRRFRDGMADTRVLEFTGGIGRRPILRQAEPREQSSTATTRVSLIIDDSTVSRLLGQPSIEKAAPRRRRASAMDGGGSFTPVELIVAALDIDVFLDSPEGVRKINDREWMNKDGKGFVEYFSKTCGSLSSTEEAGLQVSEVIVEGVVKGRALLVPPFLQVDKPAVLVHERGIAVELRRDSSTFGVIEGVAANAARDRSSVGSLFDNEVWMREQKSLIFASAHDTSRQVSAQGVLVRRGTFSPSHEMFIVNRAICSLNGALDSVARVGSARFRFEKDYGDDIKWKAVDSLSVLIGLRVDPTRIFSLCDIDLGTGGVAHVEAIVRGDVDTGVISEIFGEVRRVLGASTSIAVEAIERDNYSHREDIIVTMSR